MEKIFSTSNKKWRKKGQLNDLATLLAVPFGLALIFVVLLLVFDNINTVWQDTDNFNNESKSIVSENEGKFGSVLDNGFMLLFIGLIIAGVTSLFLIDTHPVLFVASMIGFIVLFLVAGLLANSFSDVTESGVISTYTSEFTFIPLVMNNLLATAIIVGGIFAIAFFAKVRTNR